MPKRLPIQIGPIPPRPKVTGIPTRPVARSYGSHSEVRDDALYKARRDIEHLQYELSRLQSRIARLCDTIEWEIKDWNQAMETGQRKESYESIKRRISGLRGAIAFEGLVNFDNELPEALAKGKVDDLKER